MSQAGVISVQSGLNSLVVDGNTGAASPVADVLNIVGTGSISTSASGNTVTISDSDSTTLGTAVYGDGSDLSVTFDGSSVVLGITPSANTYTLARDIFLASSTINNGVSIITNSYRIFCNGTLTNNGTIQYNGNPGATFNGGAQLSNGTGSISNTIVGGVGGAGNTGNGSAGGGGAGVNLIGNTGGAGGAGGTGTAGPAGTASGFGANSSNVKYFPNNVSLLPLTGASSVTRAIGATGGGGGGGDGVNRGGGGGGGAGLISIASRLFAGTGNIQAIGGNGANGVGGDSGGGGGGGGGFISITSRSVSGGAIAGQTLSVAGGSKGLKSGAGSDGNNGNTGNTLLMVM